MKDPAKKEHPCFLPYDELPAAQKAKDALVVCLVPARTDTAWWHDYAAKGEIVFVRGRLRAVQEHQPDTPF